MNNLTCTQVAERNMAARYVQDQLDPRQAEAFEDHYMDCPACLAELESAELMAHGFKRLAAEETAKSLLTAVVTTSWWQRRRLWLSAAAMLIAAWAALSLMPRFTVQNEASGVHTNVPVAYLQPVRGGDAGAPAHRVQAAESGPSILVLELDPPLYPVYNAVIERDGKRIFNAGDLRLAERDTLTLALGEGLLKPGEYGLHLDATTSEGRQIAVGRFAFWVEYGARGLTNAD